MSETIPLIDTTYPSYFDYNPKENMKHILLIRSNDISDKEVSKWFPTADIAYEHSELKVITLPNVRIWSVVHANNDLHKYYYTKLVARRRYDHVIIIVKTSSKREDLATLALIPAFKHQCTIIGLMDKKRKLSYNDGLEEANIHNMKYTELSAGAIEVYIKLIADHQ